jgi:CPA1 family monovalent cation:H+ antiporter
MPLDPWGILLLTKTLLTRLSCLIFIKNIPWNRASKLNIFFTIAVLISLAALFAYINARFIGLPSNIGLLCISLSVSVLVILLGKSGLYFADPLISLVKSIDFNMTLMVGMLSFLLFAGALHVDIDELLARKWKIGSFATIGVMLSTLFVGTLTWFLLPVFGLKMSYIYCLLFGAVISPTDPIAVLGILKDANAPKDYEIMITGESLFNDGVGVVIFIAILGFVSGDSSPTAASVIGLFAFEAVGGFAMGLALGWAGYHLLKSIDRYDVEILITLALVTGGYALSLKMHVSGPIAMVVAGLMIGNIGRRLAMSVRTREHLDTFWQLVDEVLNSVLFVLIGLELLAISFSGSHILLGICAIPLTLSSRFMALFIPVKVLSIWRDFPPEVLKVLTWGGLRGGISVALALSIPAGPEREIILSMTYIVVLFTIIIQGLTLKHLIKSLSYKSEESL